MNCPACNTMLKVSDRQGVEIDYCPSCRGVWLDRGELDKIIQRESSARFDERRDDYDLDDSDDGRRRHEYDDRRDRRGGYDNRNRKRGGFFSDLFDFD